MTSIRCERLAKLAKEEKIKIIDSLAEHYQKQGLRVSGSKSETRHDDESWRNEILDAVIQALDGAISEKGKRGPDYKQPSLSLPTHTHVITDVSVGTKTRIKVVFKT
jgi:hypothetical protein